jgi:cytochrome P450
MCRFLPTRQNKLMQHLDTKINTLLHEIIDNRRKSSTQTKTGSHYGDDLLGRMLTAASDGWDEDVVEFNLASVFNNCKLIFFAGQDTVAVSVVYTMMMLARYPEWQDRARQEILNVVGNDDNFDTGKLRDLKIVSHTNDSLIVYRFSDLYK